MTTFISLLMVLVAAALIGYPFLAKNRMRYGGSEVNEAAADKRELLFSALGEIEFDYRMRKLSDEDYRELKSGYQKEALALLDREDELLEKEIEKELGRHKKSGREQVPGEEDHE